MNEISLINEVSRYKQFIFEVCSWN